MKKIQTRSLMKKKNQSKWVEEDLGGGGFSDLQEKRVHEYRKKKKVQV